MQSGRLTRTGEVMAAIRLKVSSRALMPGDRLPSIRSFAATLGVSPSTVVEAYDRLVAEGLIRARRGSGFYVARTGLPAMVLGEAERGATGRSIRSGFRGNRSMQIRR